MSDLIARAWTAEIALLTPDVRKDPAQLDRLLADDFREIGQSGRLWGKTDIIAALLQDEEPTPAATVDERDERVISPDTVLLTYLLSFGDRSSRRSSLWRLEGDVVRCFFHQGTPTPLAVPPAQHA